MRSTRLRQRVNAPRASVYRALLEARAIATWMGASRHDQPRARIRPPQRGAFRISLTYDEPTGAGKTTGATATFHGRFMKLVPAGMRQLGATEVLGQKIT